jgi:hypothetical protein
MNILGKIGSCLSFARHPKFSGIEGYEDIKNIIERALDTEDNYNLLLVGLPACSKTLFLMGTLDICNDAEYFDGSNTTNRILDVLGSENLICSRICAWI